MAVSGTESSSAGYAAGGNVDVDASQPVPSRCEPPSVQPSADRTRIVGVLGMGSFVAHPLVSRLVRAGWEPSPLASRGPQGHAAATGADATPCGAVEAAVALCPIWGLVERLPMLLELGVRSLVAVSSTSRSTKAASPDPDERAVAARLAAAEEAVACWAGDHGVRATILRPTLVYDGRHDRNVARIAAFVRRWRCFPLVGEGGGLRQPLHADDLAAACVAALDAPAPGGWYDLGGGEILSYREMVSRISIAVGRRPRFVRVPRWLVHAVLPPLRRLPGFRGVSPAAFDRMNEPLVVDAAAAVADLGFAPRRFEPEAGAWS